MKDHPHAFALGICFGIFGGAVGTVGLAWLLAAVQIDKILKPR